METIENNTQEIEEFRKLLDGIKEKRDTDRKLVDDMFRIQYDLGSIKLWKSTIIEDIPCENVHVGFNNISVYLEDIREIKELPLFIKYVLEYLETRHICYKVEYNKITITDWDRSITKKIQL